MKKEIAVALIATSFFTGCATSHPAPFHHSDSGRMGVMLWKANIPKEEISEQIVSAPTGKIIIDNEKNGL